MEIVLVNPAGEASYQGDKSTKAEQYMYPYSIIYLQNYLAKNGIEAKLFDLFDTDPDELIAYCKDLDSPIIGVTSQTYSRNEAVNIIRRIKEIKPSSIAVVGGKHFTFCSKETLERIKEIDIVVRGEGEITFYELVKALRKKEDIDSIDGITYRKQDKIIINKNRKQEEDINKFSLDYDKIPELGFSRGVLLRNYEKEQIHSYPVLLGRGCSQSCVFCSFRMMKYRVRNLESVMNEIIYLKEKYNKNYFTFTDPSFCERKTFVKEFCNRLLQENLGIKWYCEARVDTPIELLELMAKAGCISLDFALESGSDKVLKAIRKNINVAQVLDFAKNCKRLGIRTLVFLMISLPEETENDAEQTLEAAKELSKYCTNVTLNTAVICPGTDLEKIAKEKGILPPDFSWYDNRFNHQCADLGPVNIPVYLENLSVEFIRDFIKRFNTIRFSKYASYTDFIRFARRGIRKIPHQSFKTNCKDVSRFFHGFWSKISRQS